MNDKKIKIINQVNGLVGVSLPNLNFTREWLTKGQIVTMPYDILEEAMFDPGFKNMIDQGILYIDDLEAAKSLGYEDEEVKVPTKYQRFTEQKLKDLILNSSFENFEKTFKKIPSEQRQELCDWAVTLRLRDPQKIAFLKENMNFDVDRGIYLDKLAQE